MSDLVETDIIKGLLKTRWWHGLNPGYNSLRTFVVIGTVYLALIEVRWKTEIDQIMYRVGGTQAGNIRVGLYREGTTIDDPTGGELIVESGSVAQIGVQRLHAVDVAPTVLEPGRYYAALQGDDITGTYLAIQNASTACPWSATYAHGFGAFTDPCPALTLESFAPLMWLRVSENLP